MAFLTSEINQEKQIKSVQLKRKKQNSLFTENIIVYIEKCLYLQIKIFYLKY